MTLTTVPVMRASWVHSVAINVSQDAAPYLRDSLCRMFAHLAALHFQSAVVVE